MSETKEATKNLVIVGYDGSDQSIKALKAATEHAELYGGTLKIITAYNEPPTGYADGMFGITEINPEILEAAKSSAEELGQEAVAKAKEFGEPNVEFEAVLGRPSQALIDASENARLLVVGARGDGAWRRLLLGSTSTEIIHHAEIPVLVIR